MKALHTQLRALRKAQHLTQQEVAGKAGISRRRYVGIEKGESTTVETMQAIAKAIGTHLTFEKSSKFCAVGSFFIKIFAFIFN